MTLKRGALGGAPLFAFMGGVYDLRRVPVRCEFDMATVRILLFSVYALMHWRLLINFFEALRV